MSKTAQLSRELVAIRRRYRKTHMTEAQISCLMALDALNQRSTNAEITEMTGTMVTDRVAATLVKLNFIKREKIKVGGKYHYSHQITMQGKLELEKVILGKVVSE